MRPITPVSKRILVTSTSNESLRRAGNYIHTFPPGHNAAGLTPAETLALGERPVRNGEKGILDAIKELYSCKPTPTSYDVYTNDAVFHDPIGVATGVDSIKAQFSALAKLFPRADIPKFRLLDNPASIPSSTILIDQDVAYYRNADGSIPTKTVNSLLTIETNGECKIVRHTDEWDHKSSAAEDDGFFGILNEERKKITVALTDGFTTKKPPNED